MKLVIMALMLSFGSFALATDEVLFVGTEKNSGKRCAVSIENRDGGSNGVARVKYSTEDYTLKFANVTLLEGDAIKASGLFYKDGERFRTVIGAPYFPLGTYYFVDLKETAQGFEIKTSVEVTFIVSGVEVSQTTDYCQ